LSFDSKHKSSVLSLQTNLNSTSLTPTRIASTTNFTKQQMVQFSNKKTLMLTEITNEPANSNGRCMYFENINIIFIMILVKVTFFLILVSSNEAINNSRNARRRRKMADVVSKSISIRTPFRETTNDDSIIILEQQQDNQINNLKKNENKIINIQENRKSENYFVSFDENWHPNIEHVGEEYLK
jgi:hypothetical protein